MSKKDKKNSTTTPQEVPYVSLVPSPIWIDISENRRTIDGVVELPSMDEFGIIDESDQHKLAIEESKEIESKIEAEEIMQDEKTQTVALLPREINNAEKIQTITTMKSQLKFLKGYQIDGKCSLSLVKESEDKISREYQLAFGEDKFMIRSYKYNDGRTVYNLV